MVLGVTLGVRWSDLLYLHFRYWKTIFVTEKLFCKQQAPVVQTLDSAIHGINHFPADTCWGNQLCYPVDRDLSIGYRCPAMVWTTASGCATQTWNWFKDKGSSHLWEQFSIYRFNFLCNQFSSYMSPEMAGINHFCYTNISPPLSILKRQQKPLMLPYKLA